MGMSLSAIVYKEIKSVNIWNQTTLNTIMVCGDNLCGAISQSINKNYLLLTDVPEFVDMNNNTFHLEYSDSFSGALLMTINNYPFIYGVPLSAKNQLLNFIIIFWKTQLFV